MWFKRLHSNWEQLTEDKRDNSPWTEPLPAFMMADGELPDGLLRRGIRTGDTVMVRTMDISTPVVKGLVVCVHELSEGTVLAVLPPRHSRPKFWHTDCVRGNFAFVLLLLFSLFGRCLGFSC
jgi:hypothetical protein